MPSALQASVDVENASLEECLSVARAAENEKKTELALQLWKIVMRRFPGDSAGYLGAGMLLKGSQRLAEADKVLAEAVTRFPADERIAVAFAWVAHSGASLMEANRRWASVRRNFPACLDGYFGGGSTLCSLRQFDEADDVYRMAFVRFPMARHLVSDFAAVAQMRGDDAEASRRWSMLRTLFPKDVDGYLQHARTLARVMKYQEADVVLGEALALFPNNLPTMIEYAKLAEERGLLSEALKRWDLMVTQFHGSVEGYLGAAGVLNKLGRFDDAQTVLQPALRMFPDSLAVAELNAWIASNRQDNIEAATRWSVVLSRFPMQPSAYAGAIASLLAAGKIQDATDLTQRAMNLFPTDVNFAMAFARLPDYIQAWDESRIRWKHVNEQFPFHKGVQGGYAQSCLRAMQIDLAEQILIDAVAYHGDDLTLLRIYADCAMQRREWDLAEVRWRAVVDKYPGHSLSWIGLGAMLRAAGKIDESEALLCEAIRRFPDQAEIERQLALTVSARREWPIALSRWSDLKKKYPTDLAIQSSIKEVLWHAKQDLSVAASVPADAHDAVPFEIPTNLLQIESIKGRNSSLCQLLMKFESLGDTCEFGMVQRHFGAEPISLLRWTSTPPKYLTVALDSHFAGVGDPEYTVITTSPHGEYTTTDRRYHMFSHTFTPATSLPIEKFANQHLRRMQYLRRKLLDDLAAGEKIFVYKSEQGLSDKECTALFSAIQKYNCRTALFCVRLADNAHACGTVQQVDSALFLGYIDRFSTIDINTEAWVQLCQKVDGLWFSQSQQSEV